MISKFRQTSVSEKSGVREANGESGEAPLKASERERPSVARKRRDKVPAEAKKPEKGPKVELKPAVLGREQVMRALRAASRSVHVMELITLLERDKGEKEHMRQLLEELASLGMAKELPGNKFKYVQPRAGAAAKVLAARQPERVREEAPREETRPRAREEQRREAPRVPEPRELRPRDEAPKRASRDPDVIAPGRLGGWLSMTPRGFGFVTCDDGGPDAFIPPPAIGTAMHGDRVEVRVRASLKGRDGEIVRVIARGLQRVAGKLVKTRSHFFVEPGDPRVPERFVVEGPIPLETADGAEVVGQVIRHPDRAGEIGAVRILRVLGAKGTANTEIEKVLIREGVIEEFPDDVIQEALGFPVRVPEEELAHREDLRGLDLCTIDPEDARDHDDAVWAEKNDRGFRVVVAIADVSHYVRPGSPIDIEAQKRGCSIYLPDRAIPMLPPELSTNLASLVDAEDRLTLAVDCQLDPRGALTSFRFVEGVMRSRARLTYGGVARALGWTTEPKADPEAEARKPLLEVLAEVSTLLRARRNKRGALSFELPEAKVKLGPLTNGVREPIDVIKQKGDAGVKRAYETIEDLMLLANETVGAELARRAIAAPFRVHGKPDASRIAQFAAVAEAFGLALPPDAIERPKALQEVLAQIAGTPHEGALGYLLLRAMQQAIYSLDNIGHFALAASDYLHFTSPIRRYPDLVVHRIVRDIARNKEIDRSEKAIQARRIEAIQSSRMERRSMTVERDAKAICATLIMQPKIGETFEGVVSGLSPEMIFIMLDAPFVEASIPLERVDGKASREPWSLDGLGIRAYAARSGRSLALGDRVTVKLENVSLADRKSYASLVAITRSESPVAAASGTRSVRADHPSDGDRKPKKKAARGPDKKRLGTSPPRRGRAEKSPRRR